MRPGPHRHLGRLLQLFSRGAVSDSDALADGYTKTAMARDIHALMVGLKYPKVKIVGHDLLVLSGEKAGGSFLIDQGRLVANNVDGVIVKGSGHWLTKKRLTRSFRSWLNFSTSKQLAASDKTRKPPIRTCCHKVRFI